MSSDWQIGRGMGRAMFRLGLAEFRSAACPIESPHVQPTDLGMPGMAIPTEAAGPRMTGHSVSEMDAANQSLQTTSIGLDDPGRDGPEPQIDR